MSATPSPAPSASANSPPPVQVGSLPPLRRPNRKPIYIGVAVAVVVVLLLLVFVLPGNGGSGGSAGAIPYSKAAPAAANAISNYQGTSWALFVAVGLTSPTAVSVPLNSSTTSSSNCTVTPAPGVSRNLSFSAYTGNQSAGVASLWEFLFRDAGGAIAIVTVTNGASTVFGTLTGSCATFFGLLQPVPANVIDSTQAAAAVEPDAASFLAQHPNASSGFGLIGGISFLGKTIGAEWTVAYSTCPVGVANSTATGAEFNATVNATTGQVIYSQNMTSVTCGSSGTLILAHAAGPARLDLLLARP